MSGAKTSYNALDKNDALKACFWTREETKTAKKTEIGKPDAHTSCPMSGKKLRLKDLVTLKMEFTHEDKKEGNDMYACAVSKKPIVHQQAIALKPSGIVISKDTYEKVVKDAMACPVTGKKLVEKDIIRLQKGGSGFCSHSKTQVKKHMTVFSKYNDGASRGFNMPSQY